MKEDFGPYHQLALIYHTDLVALWAEANRKWLTDKAKVNEMIKFIPRKYRIEMHVFKKNNEKGVRRTTEEALKEGFWVGLRSCYLYQPLGKAPWIMAMKSRRALRLFFEKRGKEERQLWQGTPAHYEEWLADPGLKEIIVMFNPPRLCPKYRKEHLVVRGEIFANILRVEMRLNTDQLRDIEEKAKREDLIIFNMPLQDPFRFEKTPIVASFGKKYFKEGVHWPEKKTIKMFDGLFGEFKPENPRYSRLIKPEVLKIAHQVATIIFDEWCQAPFNLYYRLQALGRFGLGTLEAQGRMEKGRVKYLLVYGLRGPRDIAWSRLKPLKAGSAMIQ